MIGRSSELFSLGNEEARRETIKLRSEKLNLIVINYKVGKPGEQHTARALPGTQPGDPYYEKLRSQAMSASWGSILQSHFGMLIFFFDLFI